LGCRPALKIILGAVLILGVLPAGGQAWVNGTGMADFSTSFIDRAKDFEYNSAMTGDGHLKIDGNNTSYSGNVPLVGSRRVRSGAGLAFMENFSVNRMERSHNTNFGASSLPGVSFDNRVSFNGTWEIDAGMHKTLGRNVESHQMYTGDFEIKNTIVFGG